ncbi:hypothetical protein CEXT_264641 [Caerostris extrusa]|uniref:Uncharacterized protein n=1 Tax=Caerostris extrusa TaxID=172846 RepID=A0AAV4U4I5_CAEEX|nr:hypothetical protein CEXT_264641 [Caerostris extrusa]
MCCHISPQNISQSRWGLMWENERMRARIALSRESAIWKGCGQVLCPMYLLDAFKFSSKCSKEKWCELALLKTFNKGNRGERTPGTLIPPNKCVALFHHRTSARVGGV